MFAPRPWASSAARDGLTVLLERTCPAAPPAACSGSTSPSRRRCSWRPTSGSRSTGWRTPTLSARARSLNHCGTPSSTRSSSPRRAGGGAADPDGASAAARRQVRAQLEQGASGRAPPEESALMRIWLDRLDHDRDRDRDRDRRPPDDFTFLVEHASLSARGSGWSSCSQPCSHGCSTAAPPRGAAARSVRGVARRGARPHPAADGTRPAVSAVRCSSSSPSRASTLSPTSRCSCRSCSSSGLRRPPPSRSSRVRSRSRRHEAVQALAPALGRRCDTKRTGS